MKVVYNNCYGGFSLSKKAIDLYKELTGKSEEISAYGINRHDHALVKVVETLGAKADGYLASLRIKEIKGNKYRIEEYDGIESVIEPDDIEWVEVESGKMT